MLHLVYTSTATRPFADEDAAEVLRSARRLNASLGVTGLLCHARGTFLQVLEGEAEALERVYEQVLASSRHHRLLRTPLIDVPERVFPQWHMGFERALPGEVAGRLLQPLVDHRLVTGQQVRDVLLARFTSTAAA